MSKDISKIRIPLLVTGIVLFFMLAISTFTQGNLDEDYIGFQLFRNNLTVNNISIRVGDKDNLDYVMNQLDLSFYLFKDSAFFYLYRLVDKDYDLILTSLEEEWKTIFYQYFRSEVIDFDILNSSLDKLLGYVDIVNGVLTTVGHNWRIFYKVLLSLNLVIFILLLIAFYHLSSGNLNNNSNGIMSVRNALIEGQEQERLRISLELHDKVAQDLFACRMLIKDISSSSKDEMLLSSIKKSLSLLDTSIKEVRDMSYTLRPPALQAIGLDSAIQSYVDNFSGKIDTPISFKAVGLVNKNIDETVSINLYRILQETLNNTAKHAHAENIDIKLIYTYPYLLLKIEDDGVGFKYVKSESKVRGRNKLGLPGIKERVSLLGGELIINTDKGEGTKILIKVPVVGNEKV
ncbi:sensor histidine kinase [Thiospirochaeta perfilievii]|uniref:histidine kinase n=1 Tax=Thiospirochaeta perfilievii TaxID=252967 RepID=A0A5C1QER5_9SPIO|nr:sensor histidine kinase [Thiospirochaeta perfilievii]QEN05136.1 sensor histidine kinase [Thiospirochaeta perfilievii]